MKIKRFRNLLCTSLLGGIVLFGSLSEAAIVTNCVPMLTYADRNVPTYDRPNGPKKGFISPSVSLVYIKQIREDGWAYGSYPLAGGKRIYRWFRMDELQGFSDFENYTTTIYGDRIVYRTSSGNNKIGNLWNDMDALVVGELGDNLKVIYRANGSGEYKMGWTPRYVDDDDYYGGNGSGNGGTFKGNIIKVYGDVHNTGSIDTSVNDSSVHDESYNDNSTNSNTEVQDNSYHDHSRTNNTNITDNSQNTTTTNVDNSQTNVNSNNERGNTEHRRPETRHE